ncbi:hypothetical protein B0H16DRAFT_1881178 [Mycena metata]|uniref:F-box domain-containing protein n=1 Tax=Mycena metata TaxID=1033252 RepID=A0AAD7JVL8_9AGAR|nr:hypothetical protein B0H16DRAFT_1881178 [Mycena metata]
MSTLETDRRCVADLDAQISELEHSEPSLSALQATRARVQERLDSYRYPVLTLLDEMVSEIFQHFLPVYPLCPPLTGLLSPTTLTQVCRAWREIALSTPSLWRAISLSLQSDIPPLRQDREVDIWVRRSRSCPMAVVISDDVYPRNFDHKSEVLATVAAHRACWEHMKIRIFRPHNLASLFRGPMPRLRHVVLYFWQESSDIEFLEAPLLHTVALDTVNASTTPNLIHCHLNIDPGDEDDEILRLPDVTLAYLQSLALFDPASHWESWISAADYLGSFTVPALRLLKISDGFLGRDPLHSLASFISKSGCKLQEMRIEEKFGTVSRLAYHDAFPSIQFSFDESAFGLAIQVEGPPKIKTSRCFQLVILENPKFGPQKPKFSDNPWRELHGAYFQRLFERLLSAVGPRYSSYPGLSDLYPAFPSLKALYHAHYYLFKSIMLALDMYSQYLVLGDPDRPHESPSPTDENDDEDPWDLNVRRYYRDARACWEDTAKELPAALSAELHFLGYDWMLGAQALVLPWLADSQIHTIRMDIPEVGKAAQQDLETLQEAYESLVQELDKRGQGQGRTEILAINTQLESAVKRFSSHRLALGTVSGHPFPKRPDSPDSDADTI